MFLFYDFPIVRDSFYQMITVESTVQNRIREECICWAVALTWRWCSGKGPRCCPCCSRRPRFPGRTAAGRICCCLTYCSKSLWANRCRWADSPRRSSGSCGRRRRAERKAASSGLSREGDARRMRQTARHVHPSCHDSSPEISLQLCDAAANPDGSAGTWVCGCVTAALSARLLIESEC